MSDLFEAQASAEPASDRPLPDRLRPESLDEIVGQDHLVGAGAPIRQMIEGDKLSSMILWGPPGCGKTTLARILSAHTRLHFEQLSAIFSGVQDLRKMFEAARVRKRNGQGTVLFVDEIHRFNSSSRRNRPLRPGTKRRTCAESSVSGNAVVCCWAPWITTEHRRRFCMKRVWIWVLLVFCPGPAMAQSSTADEQANCNASFLGNCPSEQTFTTSSDGFAAPVGALGSTVLEGMLVALLIAGGIGSRMYRRTTEGAAESSHCGTFEHQKTRGPSNGQRQ